MKPVSEKRADYGLELWSINKDVVICYYLNPNGISEIVNVNVEGGVFFGAKLIVAAQKTILERRKCVIGQDKFFATIRLIILELNEIIVLDW